MKLIFVAILLVGFSVNNYAQIAPDLSKKVDTLKYFLSKADTLRGTSFEGIDDTIDNVNNEIAERLKNILLDPRTVHINLDSLLKHEFLCVTHSRDKRLWVFSWCENTGGSWRSYINMIQYRGKNAKPKVLYAPFIPDSDDSDLNPLSALGAFYTSIYKLNSKGKDLYLCLGTDIICGTCESGIAAVIEFTKNGIGFKYNAFHQNDYYTPSVFSLDARIGDVLKFAFDPATQTLSYVYIPDDTTPVQQKETKRKKIAGKMVFNGRYFR